VLAGSPAGTLQELAHELGAAAIVVGSSHRGTVGRLLIGDVAAGLLHGSTCPVVVAPRGYEEDEAGFGRIGVAFDGSPEGEAALRAAVGFAVHGGGSVQAYTVVEPQEWTLTYIPSATPMAPEVEDARQDWAEETTSHALAAMPEAVRGSAEIVHGPVAQTLGEVSKDLDLLVCGSRGYGTVQHVLAGSVARGLSHRAACPLVVVPRELSAASEALWPGSADAPAAPRA
jgi:nucleotide-binding universal stress UspA family protein